MTRGPRGHFVVTTLPEVKAFIPRDLPPNPPLVLDDGLNDLLERANRALRRLDGIAILLRDISLRCCFYVRKEARMTEAGIVRDTPTRTRKPVFVFQAHPDLLTEATEPLL